MNIFIVAIFLLSLVIIGQQFHIHDLKVSRDQWHASCDHWYQLSLDTAKTLRRPAYINPQLRGDSNVHEL